MTRGADENSSVTASMRVAEALGGQIIGGRLRAGSLLPPEPELCRLLGVARSTLREALKLLAVKGLVQQRQRRGTMVCPRTTWVLLDRQLLAWEASRDRSGLVQRLAGLRRAVLPALAEAAADNRQLPDLRRLQQARDRLVEAAEGAGAEAFNALFQAAHDPYLASTAMILLAIEEMDAMPFRDATIAVLDAVIVGSIEETRLAMNNHVLFSKIKTTRFE